MTASASCFNGMSWMVRKPENLASRSRVVSRRASSRWPRRWWARASGAHSFSKVARAVVPDLQSLFEPADRVFVASFSIKQESPCQETVCSAGIRGQACGPLDHLANCLEGDPRVAHLESHLGNLVDPVWVRRCTESLEQLGECLSCLIPVASRRRAATRSHRLTGDSRSRRSASRRSAAARIQALLCSQ